MNLKKCKYSKCKKLINYSESPVKGCCCFEHVKLAKQEYNYTYYKKTRFNNQIFAHANIFRTCINQFGEGVEFDANFLELLRFDWDLETHRVIIGNFEYIAIGSYAYLVSKNNRVKIRKI